MSAELRISTKAVNKLLIIIVDPSFQLVKGEPCLNLGIQVLLQVHVSTLDIRAIHLSGALAMFDVWKDHRDIFILNSFPLLLTIGVAKTVLVGGRS